MEELTDRIMAAHNMINRREIRHAIKHMHKRAEKCIAVGGGHFEGKQVRFELL